VLTTLLTENIGQIEPSDLQMGISQPRVDWSQQQSTDTHDRNRYSNLWLVGEVALGYPNEYKQYTTRPLIEPEKDKLARVLPDAEDEPALKDFGRNGSYLVLRQLDQDVPAFGNLSTKRLALSGQTRTACRQPWWEETVMVRHWYQKVIKDIRELRARIISTTLSTTADPGGNKCP